MKSLKTTIIVGIILGLSVLGVIASRPKPLPIDETAQLLAEGNQSKLELQKKLSEVKITKLENGKRIFADTGWQVYLSQFNPEYQEVTASCRIEMDECDGWQTVADKLGVGTLDVKYAYYYSQDVALTVSQQIVYDAFQAFVQSAKPQTTEEETQILNSFANSHALELYELNAIIAKGDFYNPD